MVDVRGVRTVAGPARVSGRTGFSARRLNDRRRADRPHRCQLPQPLPDLVRSGPRQVHHPSLAFQASFGWQAELCDARRMSTVAAKQRRWTARQLPLSFAHSASDRPTYFGAIPLGTAFDVDFAVPPKRFVYILRSERTPGRYYTGLTSDVGARTAAHNAGRCPHTSDGTPWVVEVAIEFAGEERAVTFERYLKSGSGVAFSKRHLR